MKLIILKENLRKGILIVERAVAEHNNLPILKHILITTIGKQIKLSTTNLELGITTIIPGKVNEEGGITIPFSFFSSIISNSESERIQFIAEGGSLHIITDHYKATIQGTSPDEFPIIPTIQQTEHFLDINAGLLKKSLGDILPAAHLSEIRPELSGILFDFQISHIKLVATDSFRLAEKTIFSPQFTTSFPKGFRVIIPLKTAHELARIFSDQATIRMHADPNQIAFSSEDTKLISRVIDGQYPDYEQIVPKKNELELILDRKHFKYALKLVGGFSGKLHEVKFRPHEKEQAIEVYSANQYVGENRYTVPVRTRVEKMPELTFNARYLNDGLESIISEQFIFGINGDARPAFIKAPEDTSFFYLVMPIKNT